MTNALTYGAAASDNIVLSSGLNPSTPVGMRGEPVDRARAAADGVTPVERRDGRMERDQQRAALRLRRCASCIGHKRSERICLDRAYAAASALRTLRRLWLPAFTVRRNR